MYQLAPRTTSIEWGGPPEQVLHCYVPMLIKLYILLVVMPVFFFVDVSFFLGRRGLAITMVTQYDIERVKNIESNISKFISAMIISMVVQ